MANSCRAPAESPCLACRGRISYDAWLLIDIDERPDLVALVAAGMLNRVRCPHCGTELVFDLPVLLFLPGEVSPFLFSPAPSNTEEQNRRDAAFSEALARNHLKALWQDSWLHRGLLALSRAQLLELLSKDAPEPLRPALRRRATAVWLLQLLDVDESEERAVVEAHPELLDPLTTQMLGEWSAEARAKGSTDLDRFYTSYRVLLTRCRLIGIDAAFRERASPPTRLSNPEADRLRLDLDELINSASLEREGTQRGIELCRSLLVALDPAAEPLIAAVAQGYLGNFLLDAGEDREEAFDLAEKAFGNPLLLQSAPGLIAKLWLSFVNKASPSHLARAMAAVESTLPALASEEHADAAILARHLLAERSGEESTIEHLEAAVARATSDVQAEVKAEMQLELVKTYVIRSLGNHAENLERAIACGLEAAEYFTRERSERHWATAQLYLSNAFFRRIRGERASNLEAALQHAERVLETPPDRFPELPATAHNNLGNIYAHRLGGNRSTNLHHSLWHYERALEHFTRDRFPEDWARLQLNLGHLFLMEPNGFGFDDIETAIRFLERSLEVRTRERNPADWGATKLILGLAYTRLLRGDPKQNAVSAARHLQEALEVFSRDRYPLSWAQAHLNLAEVHLQRRKSTGDSSMITVKFDELSEEDMEEGLRHLREAALEMTRDRTPAQFRFIQVRIADICFVRKQWAEAHAAYAMAIDVGRELFDTSYSELGRWAEIKATESAYANDAFCLYALGDLSGAFLQMERGKARLLSEALTLSDVALERVEDEMRMDLQQARARVRTLEDAMQSAARNGQNREWIEIGDELHAARAWLRSLMDDVRVRQPDLMPRDLDLATALSIAPPTGAIVAPLITRAGAVAFVLRAGLDDIAENDVVELAEFNSGDLDSLLFGSAPVIAIVDHPPFDGWLAKREGDAWIERIQTTSRSLWDSVMSPIEKRLRNLSLGEEAPVLILPHRGLGLLPLHAASDGDGRCFLDTFTVSFAPGAQALAAKRQVAATSEPTLLAAVNPTENLLFAELEGLSVASCFADDRRVLLERSEARLGRVIQAAAGRTHLHFSCHGIFRWDDVPQSGLLMSDGEVLSLARVVRELDLRSARLVTLSACDTGQTEASDTPDEFFGLPAAFLQAGAQAVVCALWPVEDVSTALLMSRFYATHLAGATPAEALRHAQSWMRQVTAGELARRFWDERAKEAHATEVVSAAWRRFVAMTPGHRPFEHPFFWAAFTLYGT